MQGFEAKTLIFNDDVSDKFLEGAKAVYDAVTTTMGPGGNFVVFEESNRLYPTITKDGVSVARRIQLKDKFADMSAQLMIESANKQVHETGDGTTLTILLTFELYKAGIEALKTKKNRAEFKAELQKSVDKVQKRLKEVAIPITPEMLVDIATISCNNDKELGLMIADAITKVGPLGIVTAGKSNKSCNFIEHSHGYSWKRGVEYPEFMTKVGKLEYPECMIVVTNEPINWATDLVKLIEIVGLEPTVIIAPHIKDEAMGAIRHNTQKGNCRLAVISPEAIGESQMYELLDICALTGAKMLSAETGNQLRNIKAEDIGKCISLTSNMQKDTTIISENLDTYHDRIEELKALLISKHGQPEENMIKNSLAKLTGGIAEIKVHASTETEQREIMDRVDDAILACRSAIEEGIVEGGGVALNKIALELNWDISPVIYNVLRKPIRKILKNADFEEDVIVDIIDNARAYVAEKRNVSDDGMITLGVIDPVKVIRTALNNAISISGLLLQTTCCIAEVRE